MGISVRRRSAGWGCRLWFLLAGSRRALGLVRCGRVRRVETRAFRRGAASGVPGRGRGQRGKDLSGSERRRLEGLLSAHRRDQRPQHRAGPRRGRVSHPVSQGGPLGPGSGRGAGEPGHGQALERQRAQDRQVVDPGGGTAAATAVGPGQNGGRRARDPHSPAQLRQGGGTEPDPQEGSLPPGRHHRG